MFQKKSQILQSVTSLSTDVTIAAIDAIPLPWTAPAASALLTAAGGAAEDAKFGAVRVIERERYARSDEIGAEVERLLIRQQGAGDDARPRLALALHDHSRRRAHDAVGRFAENTPAGARDLRDVHGGVHLRKDHQGHGIVGVDPSSELGEETGEAPPQRCLRLDGEITACDMHRKPVLREPEKALDRQPPAAAAAFSLVHGRTVMVDRDAHGEPV